MKNLRLTGFITIFLSLITMVVPSKSELLFAHTSQQIVINSGKCLSFGSKVAKFRDCNHTDTNQNIHMLKLDRTLQMLIDQSGKQVMCYDRRYRKLKVFNIKRLLKIYGPESLHNLRRHKSSFGTAEANILLQSTKDKSPLECGLHENSPLNGYQYFNFGLSTTSTNGEDQMVWKPNGMVMKAKDLYCNYRKTSTSRSKERSGSVEKKQRSFRICRDRLRQAKISGEEMTSENEIGSEEFKSMSRESRRAFRISNGYSLKRCKKIIKRRRARRRRRNQVRCKKEREEFRQFMYRDRVNYPSGSLHPWIDSRET